MVKRIVSYKVENEEGITTVSLNCADGSEVKGIVDDVYNMHLLFNMKQALFVIVKNGATVLKTLSGIDTPSVSFEKGGAR